MKILIIILFVFTVNIFADDKCELVGSRVPSYYVYCPKTMSQDKVAKDVNQFAKKLKLDKKLLTFNIMVFNDKKLTPKNWNQLKKLSDKVFNKVLIGIYNKNYSGTLKEDYICLDNGKDKDCTDLLKYKH